MTDQYEIQREINLLKGVMTANAAQAIAQIDDLLKELAEHPERGWNMFPSDALENFTNGLRKIRQDFVEIQQDVKEAP